jgi:hypothetical protein
MRAYSFQFGTDYVSEVRVPDVRAMLSLRGELPADRSAFERIKQEPRNARIPAFGRRMAAR